MLPKNNTYTLCHYWSSLYYSLYLPYCGFYNSLLIINRIDGYEWKNMEKNWKTLKTEHINIKLLYRFIDTNLNVMNYGLQDKGLIVACASVDQRLPRAWISTN